MATAKEEAKTVAEPAIEKTVRTTTAISKVPDPFYRQRKKVKDLRLEQEAAFKAMDLPEGGTVDQRIEKKRNQILAGTDLGRARRAMDSKYLTAKAALSKGFVKDAEKYALEGQAIETETDWDALQTLADAEVAPFDKIVADWRSKVKEYKDAKEELETAQRVAEMLQR